MALIHNRKTFGLFDNGCFQDGTNRNFTAYNSYSADSVSGSSCAGVVSYNTYGGTAFGDQFVSVDPVNKYYQFACSVKTIQVSYNNRLGSGHIGFACYDENFLFIDHHRAFSTQNTTLTRAASPGDTVIYIGRGDWSNSTTNHVRSINFYFPGSPYPNVGGYSRYNLYNPGYQLNGITQISASEWSVALQSPLPNFGYSYPIGTALGRTEAGGGYNYALGAPNYPTTWTTYVTGVMHGYVLNGASSGANFRDGTRYIKFLNLRNYNFRTETAGNSARYLLDNILLVECPNGVAWDNSLFSRSSVI